MLMLRYEIALGAGNRAKKADGIAGGADVHARPCARPQIIRLLLKSTGRGGGGTGGAQ